jgi:hypothetical protein
MWWWWKVSCKIFRRWFSHEQGNFWNNVGTPQWGSFFFRNDHIKYVRLGRKIIERGQTEIFELIDSNCGKFKCVEGVQVGVFHVRPTWAMAPWNVWSCKQYLLRGWLEYGRQCLFHMGWVFVGGWKVCFSTDEILGWSMQVHQYVDATKRQPKPTFHNTNGQKISCLRL